MLASRRKAIWELADFLRTTLSLSIPVDLEEAIRQLSGCSNALTKDECLHLNYGDSFDAAIHTNDLSTGESPFIFNIDYANWKSPTRIRFSLAHELGHLLLHLLNEHGGVVVNQTSYRNLETTDEELEANEFAAALLMPTDAFLHCCRQSSSGIVDIARIADYFKVSQQAATVRGTILGIW